MPKLPKGMKRRRNAYYMRRIKDGREVWTPLGSDYVAACKQLRTLKREPVVANTGKVAELADLWLSSFIATGRNPKGQRVALQRVRDYLKPFLGGYVANRVKRDDVRRYRLWLETKNLATQTVAHILADARCFFRWAEDSGWIDRAPIPMRMLPRIQERVPDRLTDEEASLLSAISDPWGFAVRLGLGTGLRWGEMQRAQASHVDRGILTVSQTKSGRVRRIPLGSSLLGEIRGRVGLLLPFRDPSVFARKARRLSGVERFHPHQLRHTFACRWLEAGGSLVALQELLGHAEISTTQRYARLTDAAVQSEVARIMGNGMGNTPLRIA
jgi:integrase